MADNDETHSLNRIQLLPSSSTMGFSWNEEEQQKNGEE